LGRIEPKPQTFRLLALLSASRYAFGMDARTAKEFGTGPPRPRTQDGFRWEKESFGPLQDLPSSGEGGHPQGALSPMPPDAAKTPNL